MSVGEDGNENTDLWVIMQAGGLREEELGGGVAFTGVGNGGGRSTGENRIEEFGVRGGVKISRDGEGEGRWMSGEVEFKG